MSDAPYNYWVGMTVPAETSAAGVADFNSFYTNIHLGEVLANNPGFIRGRRYELAQDDPRGARGPRFLAVYDIDGEAGARGYIARNDGPPEVRPKYSKGPPAWEQHQIVWRLMWRRIVAVPEEAPAGEAPYMYLVGMNSPPDANAAELAEFNEFYTRIHVPEVLAAYGFARGVRYESVRAFHHPAPGGPRFLALYDIKDAAVAQAYMQRKAIPQSGGSMLSPGPLVWRRHDTLWRLMYRRIE